MEKYTVAIRAVTAMVVLAALLAMAGAGCKKTLVEPANEKGPVINLLRAIPPVVGINQPCTVYCTATEPELDPMIYIWDAVAGSFTSLEGDPLDTLGSEADSMVIWTAPSGPDVYPVWVEVSDGRDSVSIDTIEVIVASYYLRDSFGSSGMAAGYFSIPAGIAFDSLNHQVYIADYNNVRFQRSTDLLFQNFQDWTSAGELEFYTPFDVAVGPHGDVVYAVDGEYVMKFSTASLESLAVYSLENCVSVDVSADGLVWVAQGKPREGTTGEAIAILDADLSGTLHLRRGIRGPLGLAVDSKRDCFYVVQVRDETHCNVIKYAPLDETFTAVDTIGTYGIGDGQFVNPFAVAVDREGSVYVTCAGGGVTLGDTLGLSTGIQKFMEDVAGGGGMVYSERWGSRGDAEEQFISPIMGICVDYQGDVYVSDTGHDRIKIFSNR
jgi:DNA-binding beta-propeller fold protein YncE